MSEPVSRDLRTALATEWGSVVDLLGRASTGALARPTRCAGWDVSDLARHVLWGVSMEAEALERAGRGDRTPAAGSDVGVVTDGPSAARALGGHLERLLVALDALDEAESAAGSPSVEVPLAGATLPLDHVRAILRMEAGVHADDLRHALGGSSRLPEDVVTAAADFLVPFLPVASASGQAPPRPTRVQLRGQRLQVDYVHDGTTWVRDGGRDPADPDDLAAPAVDVVDVVEFVGEDEALVLLLLGRLAPGDERVSWRGPTDPRVLKRWFPGP